MTRPPPPHARVWLRPAFFLLGCALTAIGVAGVFLPLLPGTVFLILAAAAFARSSQKFETWLVTHPRFGPGIVAWRETGAIATKTKFIAIGSMAASYILIWFSGAPAIARVVSAVALTASAIFVGTRPKPPPAA